MQAHQRGVERGCEAIQVFNQSPRQWRPTRWKDDDVSEFLELMKGGPIKSATIHAVYLINPATRDKEMRSKSAFRYFVGLHARGLWLKIWIASERVSVPRSTVR